MSLDEDDLSPKEIALRLDALLEKYMSHLDKSLQLRENLSQMLKNGHFNISKAKYSMGPLAVSQYKYPGIIHPSSLIKVNSSSSDACYSINTLLNTETNTVTTVTAQKRLRSNSLNNNNNTYTTNEKEDNDEQERNTYDAPILIGETSKDSPSGVSRLRRRKGDSSMSTSHSYSEGGSGSGGLTRKKKVKDDERSADDSSIPVQYSKTAKSNGEARASLEKEKIERMLAAMKIGGIGGGRGGGGGDSDEEQEEEVKYKNPLNWFGVLVPQNLRQAQTDFSKAVDLIVEIANVVHQMEVYQQEYFSLLAKKEAK
eukprot:Phypoly_transcript_02277.p2 GENE.Phypoly_transcript_02277~~Phypoly_transcript_02277.p2  ORF type:complete len:313 (-),score=74.81 Phypoly_transcript_02277:59-997(-)